MAKISQYFKDKAKTIKDYPKTLIKAVYGDDGKRLDNIISDITSDIDSTKAKIGTTDISKYSDGTVTGGLSVLSNNAYDLKMLGWTVPKECPVQNYVDEDGVFHQIVGRVDLSKLMWEWADTLNEFRTDLYIIGMNPYSTNIYCSKYQFGSEMYISGMGIYIKDPNYDSSTISQFKADNKGVYFYYELATEITKPVDGNEAIKLLNDKLGNTDISSIGDGTITGGIKSVSDKADQNASDITALNSNLYTIGYIEYKNGTSIVLSNIPEYTAGIAYGVIGANGSSVFAFAVNVTNQVKISDICGYSAKSLVSASYDISKKELTFTTSVASSFRFICF